MVAPRESYSLKSRWKGAVFIFIGLCTATLLSAVLNAVWSKVGLAGLIQVELLRWFGWMGPLRWVPAVVFVVLANDFAGYWFHRLQHGPLWRFHAVHHSIEEMHAVNSYGHPVDTV